MIAALVLKPEEAKQRLDKIIDICGRGNVARFKYGGHCIKHVTDPKMDDMGDMKACWHNGKTAWVCWDYGDLELTELTKEQAEIEMKQTEGE